MSIMDQPIVFEINVPRGGMGMLCTECRGDKVILVNHLMIDSDGVAGNWTSSKPCPTCGGSGRLKRFQPPM